MRKVQDGPNEVDSSDEDGGGAEGEKANRQEEKRECEDEERWGTRMSVPDGEQADPTL